MWATLLLAAVVLGAAQALVVTGVAALRPRGNIYLTIVGVALITTPLVVVSDQALVGQTLSRDGRIFLALMHLAIGGFLFHFMTLPDRSVTLRILAELERAPGRQLTIEALAARYSVRAMIGSRLQQLAAGGFLAVGPDGALTLLSRGRRFGGFVTGGRRLFRIDSAN